MKVMKKQLYLGTRAELEDDINKMLYARLRSMNATPKSKDPKKKEDINNQKKMRKIKRHGEKYFRRGCLPATGQKILKNNK